jgi:hypothetical protein
MLRPKKKNSLPSSLVTKKKSKNKKNYFLHVPKTITWRSVSAKNNNNKIINKKL